MTEDQDNAGEVVAGAVRVALTAAGQLAEQAARRREADFREAERDSAARVATVQSQLGAERKLALRSVRDVVQRGDTATVEEVVHAWEQARSWDDPTMATERARVGDRIRERFGVDGSGLAADRSATVRAEAATMVGRDIGQQVDDAHHRGGRPGQGIAPQGDRVDVGNDQEAAIARVLAAKSHPTPVAEAARRPTVAPVGRPNKRDGKAVEVQVPGR